ncbi:hypothetical protein ABT160_23715 [Streptomyces sp. NPDC001941]|uniref:hypothetical protein n=1 Tax=Streptomyces sp. NPDC001941 TaxID=3154659 RepID=UPI00332AEB0D
MLRDTETRRLGVVVKIVEQDWVMLARDGVRDWLAHRDEVLYPTRAEVVQFLAARVRADRDAHSRRASLSSGWPKGRPTCFPWA